jgi:hypothetical protein
MNVDLSFPHNYEVEPGGDLPSGDGESRLHYFPDDKVLGRDGLFLKVTPLDPNHPWLGIFSFGNYGSFRGVFSCPDPNILCVASEGRGYLVDSATGKFLGEVETFPLKQVVPVVSAGLLLFADDLQISALGTHGTVWKTERLAWDEVTIMGHDETTVWGTGYDPTNSIQPTSTFKVELATGRVLERSTSVPLPL